MERWFITIGEAMKRLRENHPEIAARIPDISDVIDFRNVLVHNCDDLEETIIWSSITDDLRLLYRTVCDLRNELDPPFQNPILLEQKFKYCYTNFEFAPGSFPKAPILMVL